MVVAKWLFRSSSLSKIRFVKATHRGVALREHAMTKKRGKDLIGKKEEIDEEAVNRKRKKDVKGRK